MIRVNKPSNEPAHLSRGVALTSANCALVEAHQALYRKGDRTIEIDRNIYGHKSVKGPLKTAQHSKCCYCEGTVSPTSSGEVEHYRPKKGVCQDEGHKLEYPGYYWLAYTWSNLYFSCEVCNRSHKRSFFPLSDVRKRARVHTDNIGDERPLIIDPGGADDPRKHILFEGAVAKGLTKKGRQTVKTLSLNRSELYEARLTLFKKLKALSTVLKSFEASPNPDHVRDEQVIRQLLADAVKPEAQFSAMAQDFLDGK